MNKKVNLAIMFMLSSLFALNLNANDVLTGDRRTACEVLLCLSSGQRPSECDPALKHFYSIKGKKAGDTLKKRKKFLELCPTDSGNTATNIILADYKGMLASVNPDECKPEYLNKQFQNINRDTHIKYYRNNYLTSDSIKNSYTRINPNMPSHCPTFINHEYTDYRMPKYGCDGKYYTVAGFNRGYELITITKEEYGKLNPNDRHYETRSYSYECGGDSSRTCYVKEEYYYQKIKIPKTCWSY
ncbi:TrbM/KikA/MpfK family conjugal transfer protein [Campylobacter coli]|uniref:TrbM/KikA/MpfK family conjugal transfer protein n=1 Tax=Campylobacter coli TaxID=195 RepID=UPI000930206D|nr:TrbM/KikA/MpfK family conjugal transfer protein [Campylobacter coli]